MHIVTLYYGNMKENSLANILNLFKGKLEVVEFNNGLFGIRKRRLWFPDMFLDLESNNDTWWTINSEYFYRCFLIKSKVIVIFLSLSKPKQKLDEVKRVFTKEEIDDIELHELY